MYKIDLHTHSIMSHDGGITEKEYTDVLESGRLDYVAITDHNEISLAEKLYKTLGERIIIGEEISTQKGEIIGLFLQKRVEPRLSVLSTIRAIHEQGGLVYIPHPFDSLRSGIGEKEVKEHVKDIDILEGFNGRLIFRWENTKASRFAKNHNVTMGVGSDAHTAQGLGFTYAVVAKPFIKNEAVNLLQLAKFNTVYQPMSAYFAPKLNKLKKLL